MGKNVKIEAKNIEIEDNVTIGDNTVIRTKNLHIGYGTTIEENCKILCKDNFDVGDNCFIGHDSKILVPVFKCYDYVELHNHLFCNGEKPCKLGYNVWIGQNCVLNARSPLTIGNGVGIGVYSSVWTHVMHGELLEGCTLYKVVPTIIEDDVWIVGSYNVIAGGLTIGKKCVILSGSQVTKNVPSNTIWGGNPAVDITAKMKNPPYKEITLDEKYEMMKKFVEEFYEICPEYKGQIQFIPELTSENISTLLTSKIVITKRSTVHLWVVFNSLKTVFELSTKTYNKQLTPIEIAFIKSLLYEKARFLPCQMF